MTDQMQGRVLDSQSPCQTPNLDRLAQRGTRFARAYTPNAVCSPARASLMTGLLPHNHGVLQVTHCQDDDQGCLRPEHPHWAQGLKAAGYNTGYFGKWHVERSNHLERFGWSQSATAPRPQKEPEFALEYFLEGPPGYQRSRFYGVCKTPPQQRGMGANTALATKFLDTALAATDPWCCFVSLTEPHDPFVCGEDAFALYDVDKIELPANFNDNLAGRPGIYRKAARVWAGMTTDQKKEAAACYWASITEIDALFGLLMAQVEAAGQLDNTIVVLTSDHGELLGAHGLYCKNFSGYEEVYNIPLVLAGPGIAPNQVSQARVGLHDLCPTLLELAGLQPQKVADSRSFAPLLTEPTAAAAWQTGYAEYFGGRMILTQRVLWHGDWKLVFNGFDFDELYNLADDPGEMHNLADNPTHQERLRHLTTQMWDRVRTTGDHILFNSHYPILRVAPVGPLF